MMHQVGSLEPHMLMTENGNHLSGCISLSRSILEQECNLIFHASLLSISSVRFHRIWAAHGITDGMLL